MTICLESENKYLVRYLSDGTVVEKELIFKYRLENMVIFEDMSHQEVNIFQENIIDHELLD